MNGNITWTDHANIKMRQYGLSEQRVRRVIRAPKRFEEGIVDGTVAAMQPVSLKKKDGKETWSSEIWVMYQLRRSARAIFKSQFPISKEIKNSVNRQVRIVSVWRYPGVSPSRDPIPDDVLREIREVIQ